MLEHIYVLAYIIYMLIEPDLFFKMLADPTRLRCLMLMQSEGELCVCELTQALGIIQPKISRHLAILREEGMVKDRRAGHWVYYQLNPELPDWAKTILEGCTTGVLDEAPFTEDQLSLHAMSNRPGASCCA